MYNYNLAVPQQNAWYNVVKPTYNQVAFYRTTPSDLTSFIHMKADTKDGIISDMTIFNAKDRTELMTEMVKSGFNYVVNESLNRGEVTSTFTVGNLYIAE